MKPDMEIDAIGLLCPLPVLKLRKKISGLPRGAVVRILVDDPAAVVDIPHFCKENDHILLDSETITVHNKKKPVDEYYIKKG